MAWGALISAGLGLAEAGVSAYQGKKSAKRLRGIEQEQFRRDLGAEAERDTMAEVAALRARGEAAEKTAFRTGLLGAASRGVGAGVGPGAGGPAGPGVGAISGMASQEIDPRIADVQAQTQADVMEAIGRRRRELEQGREAFLGRRQAQEAARPRGFAGVF